MSLTNVTIEELKTYYRAYTPKMFIIHKSFHVAAGLVAALLLVKLSIPLAILAAFSVGLAKEIADQIKTKGADHEPYIFSLLDLVITTLGGVVGVGASLVVNVPVFIGLLLFGIATIGLTTKLSNGQG